MPDRQGIPPTTRRRAHGRRATALASARVHPRAEAGTPPVPYGYALLIALGGLLELALAWASHLSR